MIVLKVIGALVIFTAAAGMAIAITGLLILVCMRITLDDGDNE